MGYLKLAALLLPFVKAVLTQLGKTDLIPYIEILEGPLESVSQEKLQEMNSKLIDVGQFIPSFMKLIRMALGFKLSDAEFSYMQE